MQVNQFLSKTIITTFKILRGGSSGPTLNLLPNGH